MGVVIHDYIFTPITLYLSRHKLIDISEYRCLDHVAHLDEIRSKLVIKFGTIDKMAQNPGINVIQEELTSE